MTVSAIVRGIAQSVARGVVGGWGVADAGGGVDNLLLEDGFDLLLESGVLDVLILE